MIRVHADFFKLNEPNKKEKEKLNVDIKMCAPRTENRNDQSLYDT